jgi:tetratricopeptide (TPR) repeat protein
MRAGIILIMLLTTASTMAQVSDAFHYICPTANKDSEKLFLLGNRYLKKKMWSEAIISYSGSLKLDSGFCDSYYDLSWAYELSGAISQAIEILQIADARGLQSNKLTYNWVQLPLGRLWLAANNMEQSLHFYQKAISLTPLQADSYYGASVALNKLNRNQEALDVLNKGRGLGYKEQPQIQFFAGVLSYELGLYDKAIEELLPVYKQFVKDPMMNSYLGLCYYHKGDDFYESARDYLIKAKKLGSPSDSTIERRLGIHNAKK